MYALIVVGGLMLKVRKGIATCAANQTKRIKPKQYEMWKKERKTVNQVALTHRRQMQQMILFDFDRRELVAHAIL